MVVMNLGDREKEADYFLNHEHDEESEDVHIVKIERKEEWQHYTN